MSKEQLIHAIQSHNSTASHEFLISFNEEALNNYLDHLRIRSQPRPQLWVRLQETAAVVCRTVVSPNKRVNSAALAAETVQQTAA